MSIAVISEFKNICKIQIYYPPQVPEAESQGWSFKTEKQLGKWHPISGTKLTWRKKICYSL